MRYPVSEHFDGRRFFNPGGLPAGTPLDVLRWKLTSRPARWPRSVANTHPVRIPDGVAADEVAATFVGHATFLLQFRGANLLTDPIWSACAGPFGRLGPRRVRPPALALDALPPLRAVLVSHNHYDHLDLPTLRALDRAQRPLFVTSLGNERWLKRRGIRDVVELDWWQTHPMGDGLSVTFVPAQHFAARGFTDRYKTLWGGFVVERKGVKLYFAADSGWFDGFRAIGERLGPFDLALLPIGAYEPRWFMTPVHVTPEDAVQAHLDVRSRLSVAMHFGTFQLTDESIDEPIVRLRAALAERAIPEGTFVVPEFGETILTRRAEARPGSTYGADRTRRS